MRYGTDNQPPFPDDEGSLDSLDDADPEIRGEALEALGASPVPLAPRPMRGGFPYVEERQVRVLEQALERVVGLVN